MSSAIIRRAPPRARLRRGSSGCRAWPSRPGAGAGRSAAPCTSSSSRSVSTTRVALKSSIIRSGPPRKAGKPMPKIAPMSPSRALRTTPSSQRHGRLVEHGVDQPPLAPARHRRPRPAGRRAGRRRASSTPALCPSRSGRSRGRSSGPAGRRPAAARASRPAASGRRTPRASRSPAFCATSSPTSSSSATGPTGKPHAVIARSITSIGTPSRQQDARLVQVGREDAVDPEAGTVGDHDHRLAHAPAEPDRGDDGLGRRWPRWG